LLYPFVPGKFIELHVEQGPILYQKNLDIGVVEGIQGIAWWHGEYHGEANHAGTTPLEYRKDALLGCAELCCELRRLAETHADNSVTTMGRIKVEPDIINVIPEKANFTIDFRQFEKEAFSRGKNMVENLVKTIAKKNNLGYKLSKVADVTPVRFNPEMVNLVENKTKELNLKSIRMNGGAGHDAGLLSHICPSSMIFIPSIKGISHSPDEETSSKAINKGANILLQCILSLTST
jgi:N-carbamoyl-L-amino-acid hydrolase